MCIKTILVPFSRVLALIRAIPQIDVRTNQLTIDGQEYGWLSGSYNGDTKYFDFIIKSIGDNCESIYIDGCSYHWELLISHLKNPSIQFVENYKIFLTHEQIILNPRWFEQLCDSYPFKQFIDTKQEECEFIPIENLTILIKIDLAIRCLRPNWADSKITKKYLKEDIIKKWYLERILGMIETLHNTKFISPIDYLCKLLDGILGGFLQDATDLPESYKKIFVQFLKNAIGELVPYKDELLYSDYWAFRRLLKIITILLKNEHWAQYFIDEIYIPYIPFRDNDDIDFYLHCNAVVAGLVVPSAMVPSAMVPSANIPLVTVARSCELTMFQKILEIKEIYEKNSIVLPPRWHGAEISDRYFNVNEFIATNSDIQRIQIIKECDEILCLIKLLVNI
jgi:hypothetical protein